MNDRFKVIVTYNETRKIERIIDFSDYEADKSILAGDTNMTLPVPQGHNPAVVQEAYRRVHRRTKVFPNGINISIGTSVDAYNDDGTLKPNSELLDLGLLELAEDEKLDGEEIVKLTEVEMFRKFPDREEYKTKVIDTNDTHMSAPKVDRSLGRAEYLREMTELEKHQKGIITAEEYNAWITTQRENEYNSSTDKLKYRLLFDDDLSTADKNILELEIKEKKNEIKSRLQKV